MCHLFSCHNIFCDDSGCTAPHHGHRNTVSRGQRLLTLKTTVTARRNAHQNKGQRAWPGFSQAAALWPRSSFCCLLWVHTAQPQLRSTNLEFRMTSFIIVILLTVETMVSGHGDVYTNHWAVRITGGREQADKIAAKYGYRNLGQVRAQHFSSADVVLLLCINVSCLLWYEVMITVYSCEPLFECYPNWMLVKDLRIQLT